MWGGIATDDVYVLCGLAQEQHQHLSFRCSYSAQVWTHFLQQNDMARPALSLLQNDMDWTALHRRGPSFKYSLFLYLTFGARGIEEFFEGVVLTVGISLLG